jgi:hypothetical protein
VDQPLELELLLERLQEPKQEFHHSCCNQLLELMHRSCKKELHHKYRRHSMRSSSCKRRSSRASLGDVPLVRNRCRSLKLHKDRMQRSQRHSLELHRKGIRMELQSQHRSLEQRMHMDHKKPFQRRSLVHMQTCMRTSL